MSILSGVPFSNVTVYRKDFTKKTGFRPPLITNIREYEDPLTGPSEEHILPYCKYKQLIKPTKYPDPKEYVEQLCEKYPAARVFLKDPPYGPPDFDVIDRLYDDENRSTYMISYCKIGDYDSEIAQGRRTRSLPEGWSVPETTQRCSYRAPNLLAPEGITQIKIKPTPENLRPNQREREILETKTGDSDYMAVIGKTGQEIIDGKLHGDINVRPQFDQDELLRAKLIRRN